MPTYKTTHLLANVRSVSLIGLQETLAGLFKFSWGIEKDLRWFISFGRNSKENLGHERG